ncbi:MAG: ATP-binding cassette domain-containing protein [Deltaproteobacteria bacterium]|nr:ATP-binding cassette domain-containing protein [Deltaproteobacteria bacterium]
MTSLAIEVERISKRYRKGAVHNTYPTLRETVSQAAARAWRRLATPGGGQQASADTTVWALEDLSFEVAAGEALGVIGRNGAGKTTLLRILTRITRPTAGRARLWGRVVCLLDAGAGFHPELSGRDNVFLYGALLGMRKAEIRTRFDDIVDFAGVAPFVDTALKFFSAGMAMRLAFAVAVGFDAEILVVDEVLAVGDREFYRRCLAKVASVVQQGRTVVFVSHDLAAVRTLTTRALWLERGRLVADGRTAEVIEAYSKDATPLGRVFARSGPVAEPQIRRVTVVTSEGDGRQRHGAPMTIEIAAGASSAWRYAGVGVQILNDLQQPVAGLRLEASALGGGEVAAGLEVCCRVPRLHLCGGRYSLRVRLLSGVRGEALDQVEGVCAFAVAHEAGAVAQDAMYLEDAVWTLSGPRSS